MGKTKLIRISTVPLSLKMFCKELLKEVSADYDTLAVSSSGSELDDLRSEGISTKVVEMERSISPLKDLKSLIKIIALFSKEKPDIVHSMTPKAGLLAMIAAWITRVPVRVHSFTGLLFPTATGLKKAILKTTDRITCLCATHVLPEGEGVKNDLINGKITRKPLRILGNGNLRGIDLDYYRVDDYVREETVNIKKAYNLEDSSFTFIFVGRIVRDKGMGELADAFKRLVSEHPNVHLLLLGVGEPLEDPLDKDTEYILRHTQQIHITDSWADDVRQYYASANALVFPSYREGFPNVVIEAGAMGLPSIVTDINGSREIIKQGVNGDIIPAHDSSSLYEAMKRYVEDPGYVSHLAQNCRKMIADRYEARFVRKCVKEFYKEISPSKANNC